MYQLYYYPLNASMAAHFILEALAVDYQLIKVDREKNAHKADVYLALNPAGRIPTLVHDELVLFESAAICSYLAERHPEAQLIPEITNPQRAKYLQWTAYLTNTLQTELMLYFYPERHTTNPQNSDSIVAAQTERIQNALQILDNALSNQRYLLGDKLSICDYFFFMLCVWADEINTPPLAFQHLNRYLKLLAQRPEIIQVCEKEGLSLQDYTTPYKT